MTTKRAKSAAMQFLDGLLGGPLTFSEVMRTIRECEEWTLGDMAAKLGVTRGFISNVEKGKPVSPDAAARYARILGYGEELFIRLAIQDQLRRAGLEYDVQLSRPEKRRKAG